MYTYTHTHTCTPTHTYIYTFRLNRAARRCNHAHAHTHARKTARTHTHNTHIAGIARRCIATRIPAYRTTGTQRGSRMRRRVQASEGRGSSSHAHTRARTRTSTHHMCEYSHLHIRIHACARGARRVGRVSEGPLSHMKKVPYNEGRASCRKGATRRNRCATRPPLTQHILVGDGMRAGACARGEKVPRARPLLHARLSHTARSRTLAATCSVYTSRSSNHAGSSPPAQSCWAMYT